MNIIRSHRITNYSYVLRFASMPAKSPVTSVELEQEEKGQGKYKNETHRTWIIRHRKSKVVMTTIECLLFLKNDLLKINRGDYSAYGEMWLAPKESECR